MSAAESPSRGVVYVVACGSPAAQFVPDLVRLLHARRWQVCVIASPDGRKFIDVPLLESLTGYPVRSEYKDPAEPDILPRADAVIAFPATFNTINKWALGISDTLAVGLLCEYTGLKTPVIGVPCVGTDSGLDTHPALARSLSQLAEYGVRIVYDRATYSMNDSALPSMAVEAFEQMMPAATPDR